MKRSPVLLLLVALGFAACGGDEEGEPAGAVESATTTAEAPAEPVAETTARRPRRRGAVLKVGRSQFGRILLDRRGQALYLFDKEKTSRPECYGMCARAWPPMLTRGKPRAIRGADPDLIGTTRRRDGKRQVTYAGHPLYYYVADAPGRILCHDVPEFGGVWLVVQPDGERAP